MLCAQADAKAKQEAAEAQRRKDEEKIRAGMERARRDAEASRTADEQRVRHAACHCQNTALPRDSCGCIPWQCGHASVMLQMLLCMHFPSCLQAPSGPFPVRLLAVLSSMCTRVCACAGAASQSPCLTSGVWELAGAGCKAGKGASGGQRQEGAGGAGARARGRQGQG